MIRPFEYSEITRHADGIARFEQREGPTFAGHRVRELCADEQQRLGILALPRGGRLLGVTGSEDLKNFRSGLSNRLV